MVLAIDLHRAEEVATVRSYFRHDNNNNNNNNNNVNVPKSVETTQGGKVTILWNRQVRTERTIANNKSDIIMRDNEKRTCILIDAAISADSNVIRKEAEQMLKYEDRTVEIERMWNVKTTVIPVISGATGTIWKWFREYVGQHTGKQ